MDPKMTFDHCCRDMYLSLTEWNEVPLMYETAEDTGPHYGLRDLESEVPSAISINFCPFCGTALPGALVTNWEKHEKCQRCHWTGPRDPDIMPPCICSSRYDELQKLQEEFKKFQDETYQSD
jgi:hypothetical protein